MSLFASSHNEVICLESKTIFPGSHGKQTDALILKIMSPLSLEVGTQFCF
jgi:hypothetical protein